MVEANVGRMADASMWRLRAEEYHAVAGSMRHGPVRDVFTGMAATCERLAAHASSRQVPLTRAGCLQQAQACAAFAEAMCTETARAAVRELVGRWRDLAERIGEPPQPT
jgi:hypothetical protein